MNVPELIAALGAIVGDRITTSASVLEQHGRGEGHHPAMLPHVVIYPESTEEVSRLVRVCHAFDAPVIPYGAGSSLEGQVCTVHGGVSFDLSLMNTISRVSAVDLDVTVDAGVTRLQLERALGGTGTTFYVDPGADATLGGMAATAASGTTSVRYGTMRENVLGMTVVLADGTVIRTGGRARKSAAGYDLTRLFIGSEGTLGIITELTLRLHPVPDVIVAAVCAFSSIDVAVDAVVLLLQSGANLARMELIDAITIATLNASEGLDLALLPTVFLELHANSRIVADEQIEVVRELIERMEGTCRWATAADERERLWRARHRAFYAGLASRPGSRAWATDACVPVSALADCIRETRADVAREGLSPPLVGHVGDGNFHLLLLVNPDNPDERAQATRIITRLAARAVALGGTCTGEHGIGLGKMDSLVVEHGDCIDAMRAIQRALDPTGIMNPGKLFVRACAADALVRSLTQDALWRCPDAAAFSQRLLDRTGIRMIDVLDHIIVPTSPSLEHQLTDAGFQIYVEDVVVARHDKGLFPDIILSQGTEIALAMTVESVAEFVEANDIDASVDGQADGIYRRVRAWSAPDAGFFVVERHGHVGFQIPVHPDAQLAARNTHLEHFLHREREFSDPTDSFDHTDALIQRAIDDLGAPWTCDLFLRAERSYWEGRNSAGSLQKARQDVLGLGWSNDDHHTYDASREWFHRTIGTLELLGFVCRERFYAGAEAGWGSQILEHPQLGTVIFADIDLAPEELTGDFAHSVLAPLPELRRAGLWCALHGESLLEAGLNHLECMYDQVALRAQLNAAGVEMMTPFSNFPHLYQELTVGEWWPVRAERLDRLVRDGLLSADAAAEFRERGAIGSHLENLERNQGYKGFNQPGISSVLRIIDPREFV